MLDWLGDIGGLTEALLFLCKMALLPFLKFEKASFILTRLFRFRSKNTDEQKLNSSQNKLDSLSKLKHAFKRTKGIKSMQFLSYFFCRCSKDVKEYRKKLVRAKSQVQRELDLKKFIMR